MIVHQFRKLVVSFLVHGTAQNTVITKKASRVMKCLAVDLPTMSMPTKPVLDGCDISNASMHRLKQRLTLKKYGLRGVIVVRAFYWWCSKRYYAYMSIYADVGGGSVVNRTRNSLARIPLRWMVRQCFVAGTGIMFHKDTFFKIGLDPNSLYPDILPRPPMILQNPSIHTIPVPKPGVVKNDRKAVVYTDGDGFINEAEEDLADALSPMYDQLKLARYWWLLEMIPQTIHYQCSRTENVKHKIVYVDSHFVVSLCVNGYSSLPPLIQI